MCFLGVEGSDLVQNLHVRHVQVRTRAVTLQSYIRSSEGILKHASKLLKAELPVSLRLIGKEASYAYIIYENL